MHEITKLRENKPQGEDTAKVLRQTNVTPHFRAKAQKYVSIVTNRAILHVFAIK
jgi:hypothetical protein